LIDDALGVASFKISGVERVAVKHFWLLGNFFGCVPSEKGHWHLRKRLRKSVSAFLYWNEMGRGKEAFQATCADSSLQKKACKSTRLSVPQNRQQNSKDFPHSFASSAVLIRKTFEAVIIQIPVQGFARFLSAFSD
jgi:hypothetical protein